jgi:hypothetical protein
MNDHREPRTDVVGLGGPRTDVAGLDAPNRPFGLRASDDDRKQITDALQAHYVAGRLSSLELEERVEQALAAKTVGDLDVLMADLPSLQTPPAADADRNERRHGRRARREQRERRRGGGGARAGLAAHATSYVLVMAMLVVIWLLTAGEHAYFWPVWPMFGWGIGLASHAFGVLRRPATSDEPAAYGGRVS